MPNLTRREREEKLLEIERSSGAGVRSMLTRQLAAALEAAHRREDKLREAIAQAARWNHITEAGSDSFLAILDADDVPQGKSYA
jgi:hypothetical protein